jgi:hypothetical protein
MRLGTGLLAIACALLLGACGNGSDSGTGALSSAVAERLASAADQIASSLDNGDTCDAAAEADALQREASEAIAAGDVPAELRTRLTTAVTDLVNEVNCEPPPAETQTVTQTQTVKKAPKPQKAPKAPKAPKPPKQEQQPPPTSTGDTSTTGTTG